MDCSTAALGPILSSLTTVGCDLGFERGQDDVCEVDRLELRLSGLPSRPMSTADLLEEIGASYSAAQTVLIGGSDVLVGLLTFHSVASLSHVVS